MLVARDHYCRGNNIKANYDTFLSYYDGCEYNTRFETYNKENFADINNTPRLLVTRIVIPAGNKNKLLFLFLRVSISAPRRKEGLEYLLAHRAA